MLATHLSPQLRIVATTSNWNPLPVDSRGSTFPQDVTLAQLNQVVDDVEMQDPLPERETLFLVFDTNALIDHLDTFCHFSSDIERMNIEMKIVIPSVVLSELDGLKKREDLAWFARTASTALLERVKERKSVRVQTRTETLDTPHDGHESNRTNDIYIYDCCRYFRERGQVALITGDKILSVTCEGDPKRIVTVAPPRRAWSSRELAHALFSGFAEIDLKQFRGQVPESKYRPTKSQGRLAQTEAPKADDDDGMDIDDDDAANVRDIFEDYQPSHALDDLHRQIITHFSIVLREVADRIRRAKGEVGPPASSSYAPTYRRKELHLWTVSDCLEYLGTVKTLPASEPDLRIFLLRRSEDRGWRRGQDWPRQSWENVLRALDNIGQQFEDGSMLQSLVALRPHVTEIFNTPMRPTGQ